MCSAQYSIDWMYVLPRGCASILGLDTLVAYGLYDLDVSVGHMLYVLCTVLHMLCVVVLYSVWIGVYNMLCLRPKCTFGHRPHLADMFIGNMLYICTQCTVVCHRLAVYLCSIWMCL